MKKTTNSYSIILPKKCWQCTYNKGTENVENHDPVCSVGTWHYKKAICHILMNTIYRVICHWQLFLNDVQRLKAINCCEVSDFFYYHFPAQSKFLSLIGMFGCHIFCISKLKSWFINFYKWKSYCSVTNNVIPKYG